MHKLNKGITKKARKPVWYMRKCLEAGWSGSRHQPIPWKWEEKNGEWRQEVNVWEKQKHETCGAEKPLKNVFHAWVRIK